MFLCIIRHITDQILAAFFDVEKTPYDPGFPFLFFGKKMCFGQIFVCPRAILVMFKRIGKSTAITEMKDRFIAGGFRFFLWFCTKIKGCVLIHTVKCIIFMLYCKLFRMRGRKWRI